MTINLQLLKNQAYINGNWCPAVSGAVFTISNPVDGSKITDVPDMAGTDARAAVTAAELALGNWRKQTGAERAGYLRRWFDLILEHRQELAQLITLEQGKPLAEALAEVDYGAAFVEWFAEEARRIYGELIPAPFSNQRLLVMRQPVGVAAITPWNFPLAMITRKCAPALAAGCTVVLKPAEATPLTALALVQLAERAGIPAGVLNVVTCADPEAVGSELTANPKVRKLSFTGSTRTGRMLLAKCAATIKKVSLELGGNAPFIVFADANLDLAVQGALASKFRNTGQTCICANRFLVHADVSAEFGKRLAAAVAELQVGNGLEEHAQQGPLITVAAVEKVEQHVRDALERGARLLCGGKRHALGGTFYEPTVLADVPADAQCASEETFGPVAPLIVFHAEDEVVSMANNTEAGLAAYLYTEDRSRIWRVSEALEYGMVGINDVAISNAVAPFGGIKQSGLGREGSHYGIEEYLELKYLNMQVGADN